MTIESCVKLAVERGILVPSPCLEHRREWQGCLELACSAPYGWDVLAGWLSASLGLTCWAGKYGATALSGSTVYLRLVEASTWESATIGREYAELVTGEEFATSLGYISRRLIERVGDYQIASDEQIELIKAPGTFYTRAIPGIYKSVWQYDLSNAYGSIIARLPSPYVKAYGDGNLLFKHKRHRNATELNFKAWSELQECSRNCKYLGRSLYGSMLGTTNRQRRWEKGKKHMQPLAPGAFRAFGTLVARIVYEMSYLASQTDNVVHAYTDCVATQESTGVPVWDDFGAAYKQKNCGDCDIINPVSYRVGEYMTAPFASIKAPETVGGATFSEYQTAVRVVRGDTDLPQLFSTYLLLNKNGG